jgi:uncharacterized protein (DUF111 family)
MEKEGRLLFAQTDNTSGELTGFAVGKIMELGAHNVQLMATITKKNRPGNIIIIDTDAEHEGEIALFLTRELKVTGYHRISTSHIFHEVTFAKKNLSITTHGKTVSVECAIKLIGDPAKPLSADIEHDVLVEIQRLVRENLDCPVSLHELRTLIEGRLSASGDISIELA